MPQPEGLAVALVVGRQLPVNGGTAAAVSLAYGRCFWLGSWLFVLDDVWDATDEANVIPMIISGVSWLNEDELGKEGLFAERVGERKR